MKLNPFHLLPVAALAALAALSLPVLQAQQAPPPQNQPPAPARMMILHHGGPEGGIMGIVPPGTWWKDPGTITALNLSADQQKHLDEIFLQNRIQLIHMHASLEEEQLKLEPLLNANPPDQGRSLAQISRIADLRADLEKSNARMLLNLRGVLTADQWTRLQAQRPGHHMDRDRDRDRDKGPDAMRSHGTRDGVKGGPGIPPPTRNPNDNLGNPPVPPPTS